MQPHNQNAYGIVEEEESSESHDTLYLTLSNNFPKELSPKSLSSHYTLALIESTTDISYSNQRYLIRIWCIFFSFFYLVKYVCPLGQY